MKDINPLERKIKLLIAHQGPISVSQYMTLCLSDPHYGYYQSQSPFGRSGDFITAPEISQMFGELIAIWTFQAWQTIGSPTPFLLTEMGPGRGILMDDMLRSLLRLAPDMIAAAQIRMIETSPKLAEIQKSRLEKYSLPITWQTQFNTLPSLPLILVANELFDALPIHQYIWKNDCLFERMIALDNNDELCFIKGPACLDKTFLPVAADQLANGTVIELSPARDALMQEMSDHIKEHNGTALIIDYGETEPATGDTLQAMSKHAYSDVFTNPGKDDLTSHVDFYTLAKTARHYGIESHSMTQGDFLLKLGLLERAGQLGHNQNIDTQNRIQSEVERLAGDRAMGRLFKVMCIGRAVSRFTPFSIQGPNTD